LRAPSDRHDSVAVRVARGVSTKSDRTESEAASEDAVVAIEGLTVPNIAG
jgi:hypothetical protein